MPVHRAGCAARAPSWGIFTRREDPFSFPKAEGADASVDLGITSQDKDEKEEAKGRRASVQRQDQETQGGMRVCFWGMSRCQGRSQSDRKVGIPRWRSAGQWAAYPDRPGSKACFYETLGKFSSQSLRSSSIR